MIKIKKIAILCSDDAHHKYLVALFNKEFNTVLTVVEPAAKQRKRLLKNKRYKDYRYNLYHYFRRRILGLDKYRREYFQIPIHLQSTVKSDNLIHVDWINDEITAQKLSEKKPDITIVIGTSILKPHILKAAGKTIINIHGGYLPDYRGNHCFFFACYHGYFDKIGSTIHYVDEGIDTGNIIEVIVPPIYETDTPETLYCRAEKLAIQRLVELLKEEEQGIALPTGKRSEKGNLYLTRDRGLYHDISFWLKKKKGYKIGQIKNGGNKS